MKPRTIIAPLLVLILIPVYFYRSDLYLLKAAKDARSDKIDEYNKLVKQYLPEGVYRFNKEIKETRKRVNQFGVRTSVTKSKGFQKIDFSFTSENLIIDYPYDWKKDKITNIKSIKDNVIEYEENPVYKHVKEIIIFNNSWEYDPQTKVWTF
ncbi:MAG TPA: hypothetical protein PLX41_10775 [Bacteroidales bacterium]|nr:hypothetical protein [Bacteroidales bacterium]